MNRRERRALERQGKLPKHEPAYVLKPSDMAQAALSGAGGEALQKAILERMQDSDRAVAIDTDATVLWALHRREGWAKTRLTRFYKEALWPEHRRMRMFYEMEDSYPERKKLSDMGVDVAAMYDELFALDGSYKEDLQRLKATKDADRANETAAAFSDDDGAMADRRAFVRQLGDLLSMTREGIEGLQLDGDEVVVVYKRGGALKRVNVACDSYMAVIRDVTKAIGG